MKAALYISVNVLIAIAAPSNVFSQEVPFQLLVFPVANSQVTSHFGVRKHPKTHILRHHKGIDIAAAKGTPIRAIADATVVYSGKFSGYGKLVVLKHKHSLTSHYAHCSSLNVRAGQQVKAGQKIGRVGNTGLSTGSHLHFELRIQGVAIDPTVFIQSLDAPAKG